MSLERQLRDLLVFIASMRPGQAAPDEAPSKGDEALGVVSFNEAGASSPG